ncbi:YbfB/YjiJ family MFS transporter [Kurthia sibirica]|uniref:MFS transporter n=1 Tax=Kurthia sibirica TaxID=202750 RepID=A0A2U3ALT1_9BACL|nr:YbfB/YjiJ family MFS transporter [Kurthia sibirica]PWI25469.1 MFS transporter [Kurthia sibirica]GEK34950.1 MFS transporter [Kurthia sibirica]
MRKNHLGIIIGAILFLAVAMGIGRFSFTPILPFLREAEGLSVQDGGWIASGNYFGYLIGALAAGKVVKKQKLVLMINVWVCVLSVLLMGFTSTITLWFVLRLVSGISGGFVFVMTSALLMDYLADFRLGKWSGYIFSGIGLGIAISGLTVPLVVRQSNWMAAYFILTLIAIIFILITCYLWRNLHAQPHKIAVKKESVMTGFMKWLALAYGLEGLGYIITGTFLVDIVYSIPELRPYAGFSWVVVGIGAIPSAPLWMWLMTTFSSIKVLSMAYALQVFGILLPIFYTNIFTVMLSALLFGSTFVGLVSMTTGYGRLLFPTKSASVVSVLTSYYAVGQIIGPIIAGILVGYYNNYNAALLFAGSIVALALLLLIVGHYTSTKKQVAFVQTK